MFDNRNHYLTQFSSQGSDLKSPLHPREVERNKSKTAIITGFSHLPRILKNP